MKETTVVKALLVASLLLYCFGTTYFLSTIADDCIVQHCLINVEGENCDVTYNGPNMTCYTKCDPNYYGGSINRTCYLNRQSMGMCPGSSVMYCIRIINIFIVVVMTAIIIVLTYCSTLVVSYFNDKIKQQIYTRMA